MGVICGIPYTVVHIPATVFSPPAAVQLGYIGTGENNCDQLHKGLSKKLNESL
jgi:hypothetical protein